MSILMALKSVAKKVLYYSGVFPFQHRLRNRDTLSVAMFHRVLPEKEAEELGADPLWTIRPDILSDALGFFRRHYNIVSLGQVLRYSHGGEVLPPRALLVTFDDGWRDNYTYALPVLRACGCPAVLFLAADRVEHDGPFWEEQVFAAWKTGALKIDSIRCWLDDLGAGGGQRPSDEEKLARLLIRRLQKDAPEDIDGQLERYADKPVGRFPRQMLSKEEIEQLRSNGVALGAHGFTHRPLAKLDERQLAHEFEKLVKSPVFGSRSAAERPCAISFPHGSYSKKVVEQARNQGFELMFSSDSVINDLAETSGKKRIWGRIVVDRHNVCGKNGNMDRALMARHMMFEAKRAIFEDDIAG